MDAGTQKFAFGIIHYNRPVLVVVNKNSTQGILRLMVTGNFVCSTD